MARGKMLRRITENAGLLGEPVSGVSLLEISGDDRVLVENFKCVVSYTERHIQVRVDFGLYDISGCGLVLSCMSKDQLVIHGRIDSVALHRG